MNRHAFGVTAGRMFTAHAEQPFDVASP